MSTQSRSTTIYPEPTPFPEGWYFVASRRQLTKDKLIQKTWMGVDIIAWCDQDGGVCVAEAYCPHMGAYLGSDGGGCVSDGRIVCPFHGFEFDVTGQCVATPYADPPRTARLRVFETRDIAGLIFAWWGINGRAPQWALPAGVPEQDGWSDLEVSTTRFPGHPQDTTENSVDLGHLNYVHGYDNAGRAEALSVDGHLLTSRFKFTTNRHIARIATLRFDITADTTVAGLGYSLVVIREKSIGMDLRLWVLATPVDGTLIDMTLASQVREIRKPKRWVVGLGFLPTRMRAPIMNKFMAMQQRSDVQQDVVIWSRLRYQSRPRLCRSDGEIMPFRAYCAQFYPDPINTVESLPAPPN